MVLPFVDKMLPLLDMREQVVSFAPRPVITSDNVTINVTSVIYYQILDPKNATYQIANLLPAMEQIAQTTLRNVMGSLSLDTSLTSRDEVNARLRLVLDEVTERWGVRVNRVELKDINPPTDIQLAMEKQMQAERNKRHRAHGGGRAECAGPGQRGGPASIHTACPGRGPGADHHTVGPGRIGAHGLRRRQQRGRHP